MGFFCFHALAVTKQKKPTPLDRGPPLHVNRPLETLTLILDTPARKVARLHSSGILAFDLTGQHQDKRFYVGGIIWPLGFADVIFRVERETTTENTPVFASYLFMRKSTIYDLSSSFRL